MSGIDRHKVSGFLLIMFVIVLGLWTFPGRCHAQQKPPVPSPAQEDPSPEIDVGKVEERLKEIDEKLESALALENEESAQQLGVDVAELQERNAMLRDLQSMYQRQLTSLKRRASLKKEQNNLGTILLSQKESLVSESPPYTLSFYDSFLDKLLDAEQQEKTATNTLKFIEKGLVQARTELDEAGHKLRSIQEEIDEETTEEIPLSLSWRQGYARTEAERAQANHDSQEITLENASIELRLAQLKKQIAQSKVDWIKSHLSFDQADLDRQLGLIAERRKAIQARIETLIQEQKGVENKWLEALRELDAVKADDEVGKARSSAFLRAREAWRETYHRVLDRTEIDMRILNLEEQAWQRRYELLKAEIDYAELDLWRKDTDDVIEKIESGIHLEQSHQNGVQTQILSIEKQLAEEGLDPVIQQHLETRLNALRKLTERGDEFISVLLGASETGQRLADEINLKRSRFSFQEILEELWSRIEGLWQIELWVIDERSVTVKKVVVALIILIVGMILARIVTRSLSKRLPATRLDQSSRAAIEKVLYYFALLFLVLFALRTVNIPLTVFTFLGGAVAIGIGFGAQNLINNFISGFILMMERPVKIGDLIEVDNNFGVIEGIGARCTQIRTGANVHILVPNSSFLEKNIINWTLSDKKIRAHITVGVIYGADTHKVRDLMIQAVEEHEKVLKYPEPFVLFSEFGDNALIFEVYFWIRMQRIMERRRIESALRFRIDDLFREADLVIAFPQRDVHLDTTKPLDLRILKDKDERDP